MQKCYYLPFLLKISIVAAKRTHNESFNDNDCSIGILTAISLFRRVHPRVTLQLSHFDSRSFLVNQAPSKYEKEVSESESEKSTISNGDKVGTVLMVLIIIFGCVLVLLIRRHSLQLTYFLTFLLTFGPYAYFSLYL